MTSLKNGRQWSIGLLLLAALILGSLVSAYIARDRTGLSRVVSGSMAPTLLGPHWAFACADCQFRFVCGSEYPPLDGRAVCPNCGLVADPQDLPSPQSGDRLTLDTASEDSGEINRWHMVALRRLVGQRKLFVKRVVGLPGEQIAIRHGDVYVDERPLQKSLDQFRKLALLVHDDSFRPASQLTDRWQTSNDWQSSGKHYSWNSTSVDDAPGRIDWLTYHQWPCRPLVPERTADSPIYDHYPYNQSLPRKLNQVDDILLRFDATLGDGALLVVEFPTSHGPMFIHLDQLTGTATLESGDDVLPSVVLYPKSESQSIEVAQCDGQMFVAVGGETIIRHTVGDLTTDTGKPLSLRIGAGRGQIRLQKICIYRDIYYLDPQGQADDWDSGRKLSATEYFFLGDNCPISEDSRQWIGLPKSRPTMVGRVTARKNDR